MIPLVMRLNHVITDLDKQNFHFGYYYKIDLVITFYNRLQRYMLVNDKEYCSEEHVGFGGNCITNEEIRDLWLSYIEV